ncbi:MAG: hypothetical protein V4481_02570 [Patescibacteria group bacterium]
MNTKTLTARALSTISQYLHFQVGPAVSSIPYFNNKTRGARGSLRAYVGKGSPKEIFEEVETIIIKNHIQQDTLSDEGLKKLLVDNNLGIDCSGLTFYVLQAESEERSGGAFDRKITFVNCHGLRKLSCALNPVGNCDVSTLVHDKNSRIVSLAEIQPGDFISMVGGPDGSDRNHILVIHQVEYQNSGPTKVHYTHAVAYPEDGQYGTGIKQGVIEILDPQKPITDQRWTEHETQDTTNRIYARAQKSTTEVRRLNWF